MEYLQVTRDLVGALREQGAIERMRRLPNGVVVMTHRDGEALVQAPKAES